MIHWDNRADMQHSSIHSHYGNSKDVTNTASNCLTVQIKEGTYSFLAVASNVCSSTSTRI